MFLFEILFTLTLHVCMKLVWMMSTFISFSTVTISLTRYTIPEQRKVKNLKLWGCLCWDQCNFLMHSPFTFLVSVIPKESRIKLCVLIRIFSIYGLEQQKKKEMQGLLWEKGMAKVALLWFSFTFSKIRCQKWKWFYKSQPGMTTSNQEDFA